MLFNIVIYYPCYSIIHKSKTNKIFFSPCFQVLYLRSKRNVKNVQTENTKYFCDFFPFVIFKRGDTDMDVYRTEVTFLITLGEMDFLFVFIIIIIIILWCIICYSVISVLKGSNK